MKGIDSTGASSVHVPGWRDGWMDGWMEVKAFLRIAYCNQKSKKSINLNLRKSLWLLSFSLKWKSTCQMKILMMKLPTFVSARAQALRNNEF
jgi:hypothetical protein